MRKEDNVGVGVGGEKVSDGFDEQVVELLQALGLVWFQGATSALEPLLHKRYRPQPPLIKCSLIANRSDEFLYPLLTLMKSD